MLQRCRRSSVCSPVMWRWPRGRGLSSTVALRLDILSPMSAGRRTACPSTTLIHTTRWVLHPLCSWSLFHTFSTYMFVLFRHLAGVDVSELVDSKQKNHILAVLSHALTQTTLLAATAVRWGFMYSLQWGDAEQQWPRIGMITNSHPCIIYCLSDLGRAQKCTFFVLCFKNFEVTESSCTSVGNQTIQFDVSSSQQTNKKKKSVIENWQMSTASGL